jgi:FtsZ-binding cell division protein ZapB
MSQSKNLTVTSERKKAERQELALKEEAKLMKNQVKMWKEKVTFATQQEDQASEPSLGSDDATDK